MESGQSQSVAEDLCSPSYITPRVTARGRFETEPRCHTGDYYAAHDVPLSLPMKFIANIACSDECFVFSTDLYSSGTRLNLSAISYRRVRTPRGKELRKMMVRHTVNIATVDSLDDNLRSLAINLATNAVGGS